MYIAAAFVLVCLASFSEAGFFQEIDSAVENCCKSTEAGFSHDGYVGCLLQEVKKCESCNVTSECNMTNEVITEQMKDSVFEPGDCQGDMKQAKQKVWKMVIKLIRQCVANKIMKEAEVCCAATDKGDNFSGEFKGCLKNQFLECKKCKKITEICDFQSEDIDEVFQSGEFEAADCEDINNKLVRKLMKQKQRLLIKCIENKIKNKINKCCEKKEVEQFHVKFSHCLMIDDKECPSCKKIINECNYTDADINNVPEEYKFKLEDCENQNTTLILQKLTKQSVEFMQKCGGNAKKRSKKFPKE